MLIKPIRLSAVYVFFSPLLFRGLSISTHCRPILDTTGFVNGALTKAMPVTHFSLFFSLLCPSLPSPFSLLPLAPCSPLVSLSVRLCQRSVQFSSLCRSSPSLSSLYLFILGKLKCGKHTPMEEDKSCLTMLYKPLITSHHSSPHNRRNPYTPPPVTCCLLFRLFLPTFHKATVILFTH